MMADEQPTTEESFQTVVDQQGQEAADIPGDESEGSVNEWDDMIAPDEEDSFEGDGDSEESETGEGDSPATPEGDGTESEGEGEAETSEAETSEEGQAEEEGQGQEEEEGTQQQAFDPEAYRQQREQVINEVAENYKLSDEEADKLLENPNEVLPNLAGRLFTDVYEAAIKSVQQQLPQMLTQHEQQKEAVRKSADEFYSRWPKLRGREADIEPIARAYRQANPNATREQMMRDVGAQAHWALGIPVEDSTPEPSNQPPPAPAGTGTSGGPAPDNNRPTNEFEELAIDDEPY